MKLDVLGLEAFVAVADHAGFGRAAEGLHLTQTGLTRRAQPRRGHWRAECPPGRRGCAV